MPLTTTVSMLRKAQEQGFAVGAFNVENMEMAQAMKICQGRLCAATLDQVGAAAMYREIMDSPS